MAALLILSVIFVRFRKLIPGPHRNHVVDGDRLAQPLLPRRCVTSMGGVFVLENWFKKLRELMGH